MNVKDILCSALEPLGYEIFRRDTIGADVEYPDNLIIYYLADTETVRSYDNKPAITRWLFYVAFYSYDAELVETERERIAQTLRNAGFLPKGKGGDAIGEDAGQTGWIMEFYYLEDNLNGKQ